MERVDVVVVGGEIEALAAAQAAGAAGVRTVLVCGRPLPRPTSTLIALSGADQKLVELSRAERSVDRLAVDGRGPVALGGGLTWQVVRASELDKALVAQFRKEGIEVRDGAEVVHADHDADGWKLQLSAGEAVRAPVLLVADGARSRMLETLGIAQAQRFSASSAEVVSFALATFEVGAERAEAESSYRVHESKGPLGRVELLAGKTTITAAYGPIWRGVHRYDLAWPGPTACGADVLLEAMMRRHGFRGAPVSIELAEWRIDALPAPAAFDGGLVIGGAAGHRRHHPLTAYGPLVRDGRSAGRAAARAVLEKKSDVASLASFVDQSYFEAVEADRAELDLEAHGLRRRRALADDAWRAVRR